MDKSYICPCCNQKQTRVIQWQKVLTGFDFDLESDEFTGNNPPTEPDADHHSFSCPGCGQELPYDVASKLELFSRM